MFIFCLSGPALEAHPAPDLALTPGPVPDPAPSLERAPLLARLPARPPLHPRVERSAVAQGPLLEGGNAGVLDHIRPKGGVGILLGHPIPAPVQKKKN